MARVTVGEAVRDRGTRLGAMAAASRAAFEAREDEARQLAAREGLTVEEARARLMARDYGRMRPMTADEFSVAVARYKV